MWTQTCGFTIERLTFWSQNIRFYTENSAIPHNSIVFGSHTSMIQIVWFRIARYIFWTQMHAIRGITIPYTYIL